MNSRRAIQSRSLLAALAAPLVLTLGSCNDSPTAPSLSNGLHITASVVPFDSPSAGMPMLTTALRNLSNESVTLVFGGCGVLPYIETWRGTNVYPGGEGRWGCGASVETVVLTPGAALSQHVFLGKSESVSMTGSTVLLPTGRYRAYADVHAYIGDDGTRPLDLRSRTVEFRVP